MDAELTNTLKSLDERLKYQEHLHRKHSEDGNVYHSVVVKGALLLIGTCLAVSFIGSYIAIKISK